MRVLYMGGTGEISYSCVLRSLEVGHEVTVFNRGRCGEPLPAAVRCLRGDLKDQAAYSKLGKEHFDVVCQFLAYRLETVQRDVELFGGNCGQYVFISSASAYQKPPRSYVVTEQTPLENPYWLYSRTKAQLERFVLGEHQAGRLNVTIVRPSHTYRRRFPGGVAGGDDWAWRILNDKPIIVHGDGTNLWTYTHSDDFAVPFAGLLGNPRAAGEAFHITRHMEACTWNDIYTEMGKALGKEARIVHVPTDTLIRYKSEWAGPLLGDKAWSTLFDNSKVKSVAGEFTCKVGLAEGLKGTADHYRKRAADYQPDMELHGFLDGIVAAQSALGKSQPRQA